MIDTLARHLAALREARRLTGMVLANNGAFVALQAGLAQGNGAAIADCEAALADDKIYQAFALLGMALAEAAPDLAPVADSGRLLDQISLLEIQSMARAREEMPDLAAIGDADAEYIAHNDTKPRPSTLSLGERLNRVLELTSMAEERVERAPAGFVRQREEARVSIVYPDPPVRSAASIGPPELVRLFL